MNRKLEVKSDDLSLKQGDFSDQRFELLIVFHPPSDLDLPSSGHIQREGFAIFLPGEIKDGML
jgi:hypothetical protein